MNIYTELRDMCPNSSGTPENYDHSPRMICNDVKPAELEPSLSGSGSKNSSEFESSERKGRGKMGARGSKARLSRRERRSCRRPCKSMMDPQIVGGQVRIGV